MVSTPRGDPAGRFLLALCYHRRMQISAAIAVWLCAAFALMCLGFAYTAFSGLATLTDSAERELSLGYGWFWTFLFFIAALFGVLSWLMKVGKLGKPE